MVAVASSAVDAASAPRIRCSLDGCGPPGHWWPAPAMVTSSMARPSGQAAVTVLTGPAVVTEGGSHRSTPCQAATTSTTAGALIFATPSPWPPLYGMLWSAVPWMWMTETGDGDGHGPSMVAESGPIAANTAVSQASR